MGVTPGQMCCGQVLTLLRSVQVIAGLGESECPCLKYRVAVLSLDERFGGVSMVSLEPLPLPFWRWRLAWRSLAERRGPSCLAPILPFLAV